MFDELPWKTVDWTRRREFVVCDAPPGADVKAWTDGRRIYMPLTGRSTLLASRVDRSLVRVQVIRVVSAVSSVSHSSMVFFKDRDGWRLVYDADDPAVAHYFAFDALSNA